MLLHHLGTYCNQPFFFETALSEEDRIEKYRSSALVMFENKPECWLCPPELPLQTQKI